MSDNSATRKTRPLLPTILIAIFFGPALVMLYLGRGTRAVVYFVFAHLLPVLILFGSITLAMVGFITPPVLAPVSLKIAMWTAFGLVALIGLLDALSKRRESGSRAWYSRWPVILGLAIAWGLLLPLVVRSLLFQPFHIPSASMMPTVIPGDYVAVSKSAYGVSRFSFPFAPDLIQGRRGGRLPERGDVAVYVLPRDSRTTYVKRIIGVPGDTVQIVDGIVHLNGQPLLRLEQGAYVDSSISGTLFREILPSGRSYLTLDTENGSMSDNTTMFEVPPGHYFVLGDNRDNSIDSRMAGVHGLVPEDHLLGPASMIFWNDQGKAVAERSFYEEK